MGRGNTEQHKILETDIRLFSLFPISVVLICGKLSILGKQDTCYRKI